MNRSLHCSFLYRIRVLMLSRGLMIWNLFSTYTMVNYRFNTLQFGASSLGFLNPSDDALTVG